MKDPLIEFIESRKNEIDIFCLQEIYHDATGKHKGDFEGAHLDLFSEVQSLLPDHRGYFCPTVDDYYGIATFIKRDILIKASGDITIYDNPEYDGEGNNHSRKALWHEIGVGEKQLSVLNVHGLWNGKGKTDTPERIEQSKRIRDFMDSVKGSTVVCGDFNLLPETESLSILSKDMQDLVRIHNVTSTRTSFYTRAETSGRFADYIFVSPDMKVTDFKVLPDEVSDHAALFVEVE